MRSQLDQHERRLFSGALAELERREKEALRLFRPMTTQVAVLMWLLYASELVVRGGNQAGKTLIVAAIVASAATGIALCDENGKPIPHAFPTNRPLLIWITGYDETHIGGTIYKKLFEPGAFDIIRDLETGEYRVWRPWEQSDLDREDEIEPAPPLIPERFVQEWAWEDKAKRVFSVCRLKNGTEIHAFPSGGAAPQGQAVDLIWIDEDIKIPRHVDEWQARLSKVRGKIIWSAWPHSHNDALMRMSKRATEQKHREKPDVVETVLVFSDNPYMPEDEKRKRLEGWTPEVRRSRDRGEFLDDLVRVFPSFNPDIHGMPRLEGPDKIEKILRKRQYLPPDNWTNYLSIDPGHAHAACIFGTVPPPEIGDYLVIWHALLVHSTSMADFARQINIIAGPRQFERFFIDYRYGRQKPGGIADNLAEHLAREFEKLRLRCRVTGSRFEYGSDDIGVRNQIVRSWLERREDGTTKLRFVNATTDSMRQEFLLYKHRLTKDDIVEEVQKKDNHTMDALGYMVSNDPRWVYVSERDRTQDPVLQMFRKWKRRKRGTDDNVARLGPNRTPRGVT